MYKVLTCPRRSEVSPVGDGDGDGPEDERDDCEQQHLMKMMKMMKMMKKMKMMLMMKKIGGQEDVDGGEDQ